MKEEIIYLTKYHKLGHYIDEPNQLHVYNLYDTYVAKHYRLYTIVTDLDDNFLKDKHKRAYEAVKDIMQLNGINFNINKETK